jgi:Ca-activated chloride channel family protein
MKKILTTLAMVAAALAALGSAAEVALEGGRTLVGTVVSRDTGGAVGFATVTVRGLDDASWFRQTMTGRSGEFRIEGLPEGRYRFDVFRKGYLQTVEGFVIQEGEGDIVVRVEMRASAKHDPARPDLVLVQADGVMRLDDDALGDYVASRNRGGERKEEGSPAQPDDFSAVGLEPVTEAEDHDARPSATGNTGAGNQGQSILGEKLSRSVGRAMPMSQAPPAGVATPDAISVEALAAGADEIWILERSSTVAPPEGDEDPGTGCLLAIIEEKEVPVPLEHTEVNARIDGYIASVDVRQRFHNPFDETIEAEYVFPLPHDAAVNDFLMIVGERQIRGIIREKEEARELYERARRAGHVASLLEQERPNIFRQRVANIEPGHQIEVELHYFNALPYRDGEFEFTFPLVVGPRFNPPNSADPIHAVPRGTHPAGTSVSYLAPSERSGHDVDISVELDAGMDIEDLQSLNHATSVQTDGEERALIQLSRHDRIPNKDFVLRYRVASDEVKSEVLVHREGEDGYFSMMIVPPASLENLKRAPVEFVFVLDCSGSMNGWPMEKAKRAMTRALQQLQEGDSFQIIRFSSNASALGPVPVEATPDNVRRGLDYVENLHGSGGTMMIEGIKAALDFPRDPERTRIVTFMTDGYIGNEAEIFAAVSERIGDTRIFSFGVGQSVNRHLIEGMARMGRGAVAYIGLNDDLDAVDEFYRVVRHPTLTDIRIDWGDMQTQEVFPRRVGDLFVGRPVLLHGRFQGEGRTTVTVSGSAAGQPVRMEVEVQLGDTRKREALPMIWARSEIQQIADRLAVAGDDDLMAQGLEIALNYNLVSDWTSFVAIDASEVVEQPGDRTEVVPVPVPEGVNHDTTVKER